MKNMQNICSMALLFLLMSFLIGCEKYIEFEGENKPPRLVLNGVMRPDSVFEIALSNSLGFIDIGEIAPVTNGTVGVYNESNVLIDELQHLGEGIYRGSMMPQIGERYTVRAAAPSFTEITALDIIPEPVPIADWDTLTVTDNNDPFWDFQEIKVSFSISDPVATANFYHLEIFMVQEYYLEPVYDPFTGEFSYDTIYYPEPVEQKVGFSFNDPVLTAEYDNTLGENWVYADAVTFTDELFNGNTRTFSVNMNYYGIGGESGIGGRFELRLSSVSRDLGQYLRTRARYEYVSGDPFSEPVQVFSNIENGLGIWGGASSSSVFIDFD